MECMPSSKRNSWLARPSRLRRSAAVLSISLEFLGVALGVALGVPLALGMAAVGVEGNEWPKAE